MTLFKAPGEPIGHSHGAEPPFSAMWWSPRQYSSRPVLIQWSTSDSTVAPKMAPVTGFT